MKKISLFFMALVLMLTLVGCGHKHAYQEKVVEATCTEKGYTEYTCECWDTYQDNEVAAKGHSYGEWTVVEEATEKETGLKERTCSVCNNLETEEIPMLEHVHSYKEKVVEPTCTADGYTEYKCACGHSYQDTVVPGGHVEEVLPAKAVTCTEDGLTEGKKCSRCREVLVAQEVIEAKGHVYGEWTVVKESTITEEGVREKVCECGD